MSTTSGADRPQQPAPEPAHTLTIPSDGSAPTLTCPHDPPMLNMECATLVPCVECNDDTADPAAPCVESPTGEHEHGGPGDELYHPVPQCWNVTHGDLAAALDETRFPPGVHQVWPICDDPPALYLQSTASAAVTR